MKRFLSLVKKKKRGLSPNPSKPRSALTPGYEINEKDLSKLHQAASRGDVPGIRQQLKKHDINELDRENTGAVTLLVGTKSKPNLCDNEHRSPLIKAVQCQQVQCMSVLLEHEADPDIVDINGNTALHYAVLIPSKCIVFQLLERGACLDAKNSDGCSPLILAIAQNHKEIVQFLIGEGANVSAEDHKGRTPLMIAASNGHIGLVKMLLQHNVNVFMKDKCGWTAADHALVNGHVACSHLIAEYSSQRSDPYSDSDMTGPSLLSSPDTAVECSLALGGSASDEEVSSNKSIFAGVEPELKCLTHPSEEKDLAQKHAALQAEMKALKLDLDQVQTSSQEKELRYIEENGILREKVDDLRRELNLKEETFTQTVIQYNGQLDALKTEAAMLSSKLEHEKKSKKGLQTQLELTRSHLNCTAQELERNQALQADAERSFQRERDARLRYQDKLSQELSSMYEKNSSLYQQLSKAEAKSKELDCKLHKTLHSLKVKTLLLGNTQRYLAQGATRLKDLEHLLHHHIVSTSAVKRDSACECSAQSGRDNLQLPQQLQAQNKRAFNEKCVCDAQDKFSAMYNKLRTDTKRKIHIYKERNTDLIQKYNELRETLFQFESVTVERERTLRQLLQELADTTKKLSVSEASLDVLTRATNSFEEEKKDLYEQVKNLHREMKSEKEKMKELVELKQAAESRFEEEMKRSNNFQRENSGPRKCLENRN